MDKTKPTVKKIDIPGHDFAEERKRLRMRDAFIKSEKEADRKGLQEIKDRKQLAEELKVPLEKRLENPDKYSPEAKLEKGRLFQKGGSVKMAKGGSVSKRADGIAQRGKTNCKVM